MVRYGGVAEIVTRRMRKVAAFGDCERENETAVKITIEAILCDQKPMHRDRESEECLWSGGGSHSFQRNHFKKGEL
jgi:hypothetical protein